MELHHRSECNRFEAAFPKLSVPNPPRYVEIVATRGQREYRAILHSNTSRRSKASGEQLWISDKILSEVDDGASVTYREVSRLRYNLSRLVRDPNQRLALMGLIIALLGLTIDAALAVNQVSTFIEKDSDYVTVFTILSFFLKGIGLLLVFTQGFFSDQD